MSEDIPHVVMEAYGFASQKGHTIGEGGGAVKLALLSALGANNKAAYPSTVAPNTLKKFVTGSGGKGSEKSDMKLATFKKWGAEFKDDNECDAFCLAQMGLVLVRLDARPALAQYADEALAKVTLHAEWDGTEAPESLRRPVQKTG
jgi:hypothetical protein